MCRTVGACCSTATEPSGSAYAATSCIYTAKARIDEENLASEAGLIGGGLRVKEDGGGMSELEFDSDSSEDRPGESEVESRRGEGAKRGGGQGDTGDGPE